MKQWVQKLVGQLNFDFGNKENGEETTIHINEERATILYMIDIYNKNLFEIEGHPVRKTRETLDEFAKAILAANEEDLEKTMFRMRQFFSSYRIAEYTYIQKHFEDFKNIIWDFADQLGEDMRAELAEDREIKNNLDQLREAVEANSIEGLRKQSREFIDNYVSRQARKDQRRTKRMGTIKRNLNVVKKQLVEANQNMRMDHLTGAFNRKSFDEQLKKHWQLFELSKAPVTLCTMDIDFFKKINDTFGHDIGDYVLKDCVRILNECYGRNTDFVARIGGEEFAVILTDHTAEHAVVRAEEAMARIRKEVLVHDGKEIRFTMSIGIAQLCEGESIDQWMKRSDTALYTSKQTGRNKHTVSDLKASIKAAS